MAPPWSLRQWYNHLSRLKPPPLSLVPISLACVTTFLVLLYISFTSNHLLFHYKNNSLSHNNLLRINKHEDFLTPQIIIYPQNKSLRATTTTPTTTTLHGKIKNITTKSISEDSIKDDHHGDDHLFFNDTTSLPPLTLPSTIIGLPENKHTQDDEVYHDKEIFLQNYEEMKKKLKIYIYPHDKSDPFAGSLLPSDYEPGGNYASEAYFKNVLFSSQFVTSDPSKADLFYLPFSITGLRQDRRVGVGGLRDFIRGYMASINQNYPYWNRTAGADHFYVACHSIGRMAMDKVDYVKSNAIQVVCSSSYFLPNYYTHKDVGLPQIWPRHDKLSDLGLSKRERLAFFAGAMNSPVRQAVLRAWHNDSSIFVYKGRLTTPYSEPLLGSKYCLHLKGFEVNTARIGDALFYGCVPVILADYYDLPFMDILNWPSFSVVVATPDIPNLKKILTSISDQEYSRLQANVLKVRKHFQWHKSPRDYDAFYMVMYELWLRKSSIRLIS